MAGSKVLILYATQTGNSRGVAKDVGERARERGHDARVVGMEDFKSIDFAEEPVVVVIASSTGNGDCPDNGDKFFRYCKRKTTPLDLLSNTCFAVCALGDSNYDAFCAVGKEFDKHFQRIGGKRMLKRVDVDEVEGIETFVDPWMTSMWSALDALPTGPTGAGAGATAAMDVSDAPAAAAAPPTAAAAPADATKPASSAVPAMDDDEPLGSCASNPLAARVTAARWLTGRDGASGGAVKAGGALEGEGAKRVLHVELDVSGGGETMRYEPGDAIGIVPRNEPAEVDALLKLLQVDGAEPLPPPSVAGERHPAHLVECASVRDALASRVDLGSTSTWPPLPLLRALLPAAKAGGDLARRMQTAVEQPTTPEAREAQRSLQRERPTLSELLSRLGATPPLASLLDVLPPLAPRYYSISNADTAAGAGPTGEAPPAARVMHLCLSIVEYYTVAPDGTRTRRSGLASSMLARLCEPLLGGDAAAAAADVRVDVFKREPSGHELRLPTDPSIPIVLIGPGTGLAPFRSFIQHRRYVLSRKQLGPCHVFFGSRSREEDFLYRDELEALGGSGAISLHTAFSREREACASGYWRGARLNIPYVQDEIDACAAELCELLLDGNGRVYVCGDGQNMARDVHDALRRVAMRGGVSVEEAEEKLSELSKEGRYCREIWN
jgi:sulfite reductase alpha subunit-like flavoprotein